MKKKLNKMIPMFKLNIKKWLPVIEFTVIYVATWLNLHAGLIVGLLFHIPRVLQKDERS